MIVKLLTEHNLEFLSLKGGCRGRPSLHMSKCHIVGNHMHRLKYVITTTCLSIYQFKCLILEKYSADGKKV